VPLSNSPFGTVLGTDGTRVRDGSGGVAHTVLRPGNSLFNLGAARCALSI